MIIPLLLLLFFVEGSSPYLADPSVKLSSPSILQERDQQTIAGELLRALGLTNLRHLEGAEIVGEVSETNDLTLIRIRVHKQENEESIPRGLQILPLELINSSEYGTDFFDLLYREGRLIAIFPALGKEKEAFLREKMKESRIGMVPPGDLPEWFDFSPFYAPALPLSDPKGIKAWQEFTRQWKTDQQAIEEHYSFFDERRLFPKVQGDKTPYVYVWVSLGTRQIQMRGFLPNQLNPYEEFRSNHEEVQTYFPVFPTVYPPHPESHQKNDQDYHRAIIGGFIERGDLTLVGGPGTGVDVWLNWLRSQREVYAFGINPLEVANVRVTAILAGFPVIAKVHDNVMDEEGNPVFPSMRFDRFLWNMPTLLGSKEDPKLRGRWDGHGGFRLLNQLAEGLIRILNPEGRALLWNRRQFVPKKSSSGRIVPMDPIEELFTFHGFGVDSQNTPLIRSISPPVVYFLTPPAGVKEKSEMFDAAL